MNWRQFVEDYLLFSKKDRTGVLLIVALVGMIIVVPIIFSRNEPLSIKETNILSSAIDTLNTKQAENDNKANEDYTVSNYQYQPSVKSNAPIEVFLFDPNTLSQDGWKRKDNSLQIAANSYT